MKAMRWVAGFSVLVFAAGCATQPGPTTVRYGTMGAGTGAIVGAMAGNNMPGLSRGEGAVAGAALGAIIGAALGAQQDNFNAQISAVSEQASTTVINVQNSNGSYTPVVLRKVGNQWMGPRGEYYTALPTEEQLKKPYGF